MAQKTVLTVVALALGFLAGYLVAGHRAEQDQSEVAFIRAVEGAGLAANSLILLERDDELLGDLYRGRIRDELTRAESLIEAVHRADFPIPNLVEGLVRAEARCRADSELAETAVVARRVLDHLAALHSAALAESRLAAGQS